MIRQQSAHVTTPSAHRLTTSYPARWISQLFIAGGVLWVAYYAMWIVSGVAMGAEPVRGSAFYIFTSGLFAAALVGLNGGLAGIAAAFRKHAPILGYLSLVLTLFGIASVTYGFFGRVLLGDRIGFPGGNAVLTSCIGATLLGIAAFRSKALPRRETNLLLFLGLLTFPLIVALGMIANLFLPAWATDELPFAMSGALWIAFGVLLGRLTNRPA